MMKVVFCLYKDRQEVIKQISDNAYLLISDNWNDFGLYTYFKVFFYTKSELYGSYSRKILFKGFENYDFLKDMLEKSDKLFLDWREIKPKLPDFISLGEDYVQLKKVFIEQQIIDHILKLLNDVVYLAAKDSQNALLDLKTNEAFEKSLLRDLNARKSLSEGASILYQTSLEENRFFLNINFVPNTTTTSGVSEYSYKFDFNKASLPHRINLISGKNGVGKSLSLSAISEFVLNKKSDIFKFGDDINYDFISHLIVFSYNFNDNHILDNINKSEMIGYAYYGYHKLKSYTDINVKLCLQNPGLFNLIYDLNHDPEINNEKLIKSLSDKNSKQELIKELINNQELYNFNLKQLEQLLDVISNELKTSLPRTDMADIMFQSLINILRKDHENYSKEIKINDISYFNKAIEFINKAFDCDSLSINYKDTIILKKDFYENEINLNFDFLDSEVESSKVCFFYNDKELKLSSGQVTFTNLVINLLSSIQQNSLILIDEPENTLHPNLEIDFMKILQSILEEFDSFAIILTHSSIITREVPSRYVHIIRVDSDNDIVIDNPMINTFGGDISNIVNYVFDDVLVKNKPHEEWFKNEKKNFTSFEDFEKQYKDVLGYDLMLYYFNNWDYNT